MKMRTLLLAVVAVVAVSSPAHAQSLFSTRGLGVPLPPVDARARALGGIGVGILGLNTSLVNPAEIAGVGRRGVSAALQPSSGSAEIAGAEGDMNASRFPMVRMIYPVSSRVVFSLGYGGVLEQSWAIASEGSEMIGDQPVPTRDVVRSTGGVAQLSAGLSYRITPSLAIGAAGGLYTGSLLRTIAREFLDSDLDVDLDPFQTRLRWEYSGPVGVLGMLWDPDPAFRLGASVTLANELKITAKEGVAQDDEVKMPLRATVGASALLGPQLMLAAGAEWAGRSGAEVPVITDGISFRRDTWRLGGGIEYQGFGTDTRTYPIRIGGSFTQLPYYNEGEEPGDEWTVGGGIGFRLAGDQLGPLAVADIGIERGGRSGLSSADLPDGLSESFWRFTFSLSLFGR